MAWLGALFSSGAGGAGAAAGAGAGTGAGLASSLPSTLVGSLGAQSVITPAASFTGGGAGAAGGSSLFSDMLSGISNMESNPYYQALKKVQALGGGGGGPSIPHIPSGGVYMPPRRQPRRMF